MAKNDGFSIGFYDAFNSEKNDNFMSQFVAPTKSGAYSLKPKGMSIPEASFQGKNFCFINRLQDPNGNLTDIKDLQCIIPFPETYYYDYHSYSEVENPKTLSSSGNFSCVVTEAAQIYCWGNNSAGQLGLGDYSNRDAPTLLFPSGSAP